jgi:hypothetical protein
MKRTQYTITDKDRVIIIRMIKKDKSNDQIKQKLRRYDIFQIGAIRQHLTKGSYKKLLKAI